MFLTPSHMSSFHLRAPDSMDVSESVVSIGLFNFVQFAKFQTSAWVEKCRSINLEKVDGICG